MLTHLIVVTSTPGEGEPPENAVDLLGQLKAGKLGKPDGLKFAVLGLGDSSYQFFCQAGKDFDAHLSRVVPSVCWPEPIWDVITALLPSGPSRLSPALAATLGGVGVVFCPCRLWNRIRGGKAHGA